MAGFLLTLLARLNAIKRKNPLALLTEKVGLVIQLGYVVPSVVDVNEARRASIASSTYFFVAGS